MTPEEELEKMQEDAINEFEELNDTNEDDSEREESTSSTDNLRELDDDREDIDEDEEENDTNPNEGVDDEDASDEEEVDEDNDNPEDQASETNDFSPIEVQVNGQTITLNNKDEMIQFIQNKNTTPTKHRKSQNDQLIEQAGLTESDIALLVDARNGNKAAIAKLAKQANVDVFDLSEDLAKEYKQEFTPQYMSEIDEVATDIMEDADLHSKFKEVIKSVPQDFTTEISSNPEALRNFADQVKSGLAQEIIPEAIKQQMLKGGSFIENYAKIGQQLYNAKHKATESKTVRKKNPRAEELKKKAKAQRGTNKGTKTQVTGNDIWEMSDEDFKKKFNM